MDYIRLIILTIFISSCASKIPFTSDIHKEYNLSEDKLKKVQFYTSGEIILFTSEKEEEAFIFKGKLLMKEEKNTEKITIKKNTPCVLIKIIEHNRFLFSFENEGNNFLLFGNNNNDGYYSIMAKEWNNKKAIIKYGKGEYFTTNGNVFLKVKIKKLKKLKNKQRTVKGKRI